MHFEKIFTELALPNGLINGYKWASSDRNYQRAALQHVLQDGALYGLRCED